MDWKPLVKQSILAQPRAIAKTRHTRCSLQENKYKKTEKITSKACIKLLKNKHICKREITSTKPTTERKNTKTRLFCTLCLICYFMLLFVLPMKLPLQFKDKLGQCKWQKYINIQGLNLLKLNLGKLFSPKQLLNADFAGRDIKNLSLL